MRVNLIAEEKRKFSFNYLKVGVLLAFIITAVLIAYTHYSLVVDKQILETEITNIENQLSIYIPLEEEYKKYERLIEEIKSTPEIPNYIWDGPVEAMGYIMPFQGKIDIFILRENALSIKGKTKVAEDLRIFIERMIESPHFINVDLQTIEKQEFVSFTIDADLITEEDE